MPERLFALMLFIRFIYVAFKIISDSMSFVVYFLCLRNYGLILRLNNKQYAHKDRAFSGHCMKGYTIYSSY